MKKPIYDDPFHKIARLRQRKYESQIKAIMEELSVSYTRARHVRRERRKKAAQEAYKRELEQAEELTQVTRR